MSELAWEVRLMVRSLEFGMEYEMVLMLDCIEGISSAFSTVKK